MNLRHTIIIILLTFIITAGSVAQEAGISIMKKVYDRPDGDDYSGSMRMTLINKRGSTRIREMVIYSKDEGVEGKDTKTLTFFKSPADVRGTGFLQYEYDDPSKEDDRWLYLPALKKSRRISGSADDDSFMGSDFTYDDWGGRTLEDDTHKLLREETKRGFDCWVIESTPVDKDGLYSKFISWIRKDACIEVQIDFYDRHGDLMKTMTLDEVEQISGYWTPMKMTMKNVQEEHTTVIEQLDITYDQGLDESLFRVSSLERGRIR